MIMAAWWMHTGDGCMHHEDRFRCILVMDASRIIMVMVMVVDASMHYDDGCIVVIHASS